MMRRFTILFVASILGACGDDGGGDPVDGGPAQPDAAAPDAMPDPRFAELAASFEQERLALGAPGVAVAVLEDGEVAWTAGFGDRAPDGGGPVRATTLFRIGSVTKMMTATAVLQLVASGDVSLDAPITTYLPEFDVLGDPGADAITVENLLTHSTGMLDYLAIDASADDADLAAFLQGPFFASSVYLMAPPGRMYNYSNPGFMVAGLLVETETGVPYRQAMRENVFAPLGMDRTYFIASEVLGDDDYASGATTDWVDGVGAVVATPDAYDNAWARPAGYAWSSVLDLARFMQFLMDGDGAVLDATQHAAMQDEQIDTEEVVDLVHYGYGLRVQRGVFLGADGYREEKIVSHSGAIPGFSALMMYVPRTGFGMVILSNTDGAYFTDSLVLALTTFGGLPAATTPPNLAEDPADLDDYAGTYEDPYNVGAVIVTRVGDELSVSLPDVDAAGIPYEPILTPVSKRNYDLHIQGSDLSVTFILDDTGAGEYFRTRVFVAARDAAPTPMPRIAPVVDRTRLIRAIERASRARY